LLLNVVDVSCWKANDAGKELANATPATRRTANFDECYQMDLPYPFLFEPEGRPWFQSWQILEPGIKDGIGTASTAMYRLLLRGGEITAAYNTACKKDHGAFTDRAVDLQRVLNSIAAERDANPTEYAALVEYGVTWATDGFRDLLTGAIDEARAYAVSCRVGVPVTIDMLATITLPVSRYDRACRRLKVPTQSPIVNNALKRAYEALARYVVAEKRAPWHTDRTSAGDVETAQIIRHIAGVKGLKLGDSKPAMNAFLRMVALNAPAKATQLNVYQQLVDWATHNLK
jgi:hypothetical protein